MTSSGARTGDNQFQHVLANSTDTLGTGLTAASQWSECSQNGKEFQSGHVFGLDGGSGRRLPIIVSVLKMFRRSLHVGRQASVASSRQNYALEVSPKSQLTQIFPQMDVNLSGTMLHGRQRFTWIVYFGFFFISPGTTIDILDRIGIHAALFNPIGCSIHSAGEWKAEGGKKQLHSKKKRKEKATA